MLEPETQRFIDGLTANGSLPLHALSLQDARKVLSEVQAGNLPKPPAEIEDRTIPGGPTGSVRVRIVRPKGIRSVLPAVIYFHGGGWVLGDSETHDRLVRQIANGASAAVVFVDYDRAPEARYPVAIEQAYTAARFVAENGAALNLDVSRMVVAGDGAGGNIAAVVTLLAKERGGPRIGFQLLLYPVTDANFDNASYKAFANGPWLTRDSMRWFWDAYLPDAEARRHPTASPLQASLNQLKGLPPALIVTGENDVLRDEGEAYAARLSQAGVPVTAVRYLGTIHDFVMLNPIANTPAAREALSQANAVLCCFFDSM